MRTLLTALGLMLVWQGLSLSVLLKATRRSWALLEQTSDAKLRRLGVGMLLVGATVLACVT
jgi:uncharacterized protein YjeT (DUF2065 family)